MASFFRAGKTLPRVYPIVDTGTLHRLGMNSVEAAEAILEGGAAILQFRHKGFWSRQTFDDARLIASRCNQVGALFIINDRADYALLLGAGLHIGQEDLLPPDARTVIGAAPIIGFSTHNGAQMELAKTDPAIRDSIDYAAFGPVFPTLTKERPDPTTGLESLAEIRTMTALPLVAIGGITLKNAEACWNAGADSVAVIAGMFPDTCTKQSLRERVAEWLYLGEQ